MSEYSDLCWKLMLLHEQEGPSRQVLNSIVEMLFASFDQVRTPLSQAVCCAVGHLQGESSIVWWQDGDGEISLEEFYVGALAQPSLMKCFSSTIQINTAPEPLTITTKCATLQCVPNKCVVS